MFQQFPQRFICVFLRTAFTNSLTEVCFFVRISDTSRPPPEAASSHQMLPSRHFLHAEHRIWSHRRVRHRRVKKDLSHDHPQPCSHVFATEWLILTSPHTRWVLNLLCSRLHASKPFTSPEFRTIRFAASCVKDTRQAHNFPTKSSMFSISSSPASSSKTVIQDIMRFLCKDTQVYSSPLCFGRFDLHLNP